MKVVSFLPSKDLYSVLSQNCCYQLSTVALVGCFVWGRCTYMFSLKVRWKVLKSRGTGLRNIPRSLDETGFAYDSTKIGGRCPPVPLCPTGLHSFRRGGGRKQPTTYSRQCTADCRPNVLIHVMLSSKHGKNCSFWSFQYKLSIIKVKKKVLGSIPGTVPDYSK